MIGKMSYYSFPNIKTVDTVDSWQWSQCEVWILATTVMEDFCTDQSKKTKQNINNIKKNINNVK